MRLGPESGIAGHEDLRARSPVPDDETLPFFIVQMSLSLGTKIPCISGVSSLT